MLEIYILRAVHVKFSLKYFNYEMCEYTVIKSKSNVESFCAKMSVKLVLM